MNYQASKQDQDRETIITMLAGSQLPPGVEEQTKAVSEMLSAFINYYYYKQFKLWSVEGRSGSQLTRFHAEVFDASEKPITAARFALEHRLWIALTGAPEGASALVENSDQILGTPEPGVPPTPPGSGGPVDWVPRPVIPDAMGLLPPLYFDFQNGFDLGILGISNNSTTGSVNSPVTIIVVDNCALNSSSLLTELNKVKANNPLAQDMYDALGSGRLVISPEVGSPINSPSTSLMGGVNWHGLFIAGILLSLTKSAKIKLIPNMNEYGYTTLGHISEALYLLKIFPENVPTLINLSMTFRDRAINRTELTALLKVILSSSTAAEWQKYILETTDEMKYSAEQQSAFDDAYATFLVGEQSIEATLKDYSTSSMQIIAAAGNMQGLSGNDLPYREVWPGYPARINKVLAVGALNRNFSQADYSQFCEIPTLPLDVRSKYPALFGNTSTGVYTFGGDRLGWSTPLTGKGIIGLFLNDYPRPLPGGNSVVNPYGLAEWSGTSFATAVITGLLARMIETGQTLEKAKDKLLTAKNIPLLQTAVTRPDWLKN